VLNIQQNKSSQLLGGNIDRKPRERVNCFRLTPYITNSMHITRAKWIPLGRIAGMQCIDTASCYRCSVVCVSAIATSCAKTAEPVEMSMGWVLGWAQGTASQVGVKWIKYAYSFRPTLSPTRTRTLESRTYFTLGLITTIIILHRKNGVNVAYCYIWRTYFDLCVFCMSVSPVSTAKPTWPIEMPPGVDSHEPKKERNRLECTLAPLCD